jgi:hypothetical protein
MMDDARADSSANGTMVKVPLSSDDQRHASVVPGAPGVDDDLIRDHKGRVKADAANQGFLARVIGRKLAQEGLGAGAGDGAEPLGQSHRGSCRRHCPRRSPSLASGLIAISIANGAPSSMSSGLAIAS